MPPPGPPVPLPAAGRGHFGRLGEWHEVVTEEALDGCRRRLWTGDCGSPSGPSMGNDGRDAGLVHAVVGHGELAGPRRPCASPRCLRQARCELARSTPGQKQQNKGRGSEISSRRFERDGSRSGSWCCSRLRAARVGKAGPRGRLTAAVAP
jgi:hypothetical protein